MNKGWFGVGNRPSSGKGVKDENAERLERVHDQWRETERRRLLAQLGPGYAAISG